jgi:hypothetical protein
MLAAQISGVGLMGLIVGKIVGPKHTRPGDPVPFNRMLANLQLATAEKLLEEWRYLNRTREAKAEAHIDFDYAILAATELLKELALIESAFGYQRTVKWITDCRELAEIELAARAKKQAARERPREGEAS